MKDVIAEIETELKEHVQEKIMLATEPLPEDENKPILRLKKRNDFNLEDLDGD
jgi:hypothetical protein